MSHTFTQLTVHAVFGTKERRAVIPEAIQPRLHPYMAAALNDGFGMSREVGGTADHVHVLFDLDKNVSVADSMRHVKSVSSGWVHNTFPELREFGWQPGYGAFSVSASAISEVSQYIRDQPEHHKKGSFEQEFRALLAKYGISYDERFLWR